MFKKPILIGISPNTESDDVWLALRLLFSFRFWQEGPNLARLESEIKRYFDFPYCYLVNAGRTALYLILKSLNLRPGAEIIHLDFTCGVVPEAIVRAGGKPAAAADLTKAKISKRTRAIIVQHTFGVPDNLDKIRKICKKNKIVLIEDLAHGLGAKYHGRPVGGFGDFTMLSFGRDKVISSVFGGAILARKPLALNLPCPSKFWIFKQLLHPLIMALAVPGYFFGGKLLIYLARKLKLIVLPLAELPSARLPNALAVLALNQWKKLERFNRHRQRLARFYGRQLNRPFNPDGIYLRFPLSVKDPKRFLADAKKQQLLLGNWYDNKIVNLPTHIKMNLTDARRVAEFAKNYV